MKASWPRAWTWTAASGARRPGPVPSPGRLLPAAVQRLDLGRAAREVAAHLELRRQLLRASEAGSRHRTGNAFQRSGGILVTAVRSSRLPMLARSLRPSRDLPRPLGGARSDLRSTRNWCPCSPRVDAAEVLPAPGHPRPRIDALATLVPADGRGDSAARSEPGAHGRDGFDRDARLAARASARRAVQRGLFERRCGTRSRRGRSRSGRSFEHRHHGAASTGAAALPDVMIEGVSGSLVSHSLRRASARDGVRRPPGRAVQGSCPAAHPGLVAPRWLRAWAPRLRCERCSISAPRRWSACSDSRRASLETH